MIHTIKIINNNMELHKCGVREGMEIQAKREHKSLVEKMWFIAPDSTECVIYPPDYEIITKED